MALCRQTLKVNSTVAECDASLSKKQNMTIIIYYNIMSLQLKPMILYNSEDLFNKNLIIIVTCFIEQLGDRCTNMMALLQVLSVLRTP